MKKTSGFMDKQYDIDGIISDNRLGVFNKNVPSVYITHQLNVMTGNTTWLTVKLHHILKIYGMLGSDAGQPNLAGELSHSDNLPFYLNT
jgi:hypothetical protein